MAFGRKMHDDIRIEIGKSGFHRGRVANIALPERITAIVRDRGERGKISSIGQLVEDKHAMLRVLDDPTRDRGTDEPCSARDENPHEWSEFALILKELLAQLRRR